MKNIGFRERFTLQFRGEFLNALNHPIFANPFTAVTSTAFGAITIANAPPRRVQVGVKLVY